MAGGIARVGCFCVCFCFGDVGGDGWVEVVMVVLLWTGKMRGEKRYGWLGHE